MKQYSKNYKRHKHPLIMRLIAIWRVITCRNFILIDFDEITDRTLPARRVRPLYRSDYDAESEALTLKAALFMAEDKIIKSYRQAVGE